MITTPANRSKSLAGLEIAFVALLCWVLLSNILTDSKGNGVQASDQKSAEQKRANKEKRSQKRWVPEEGIPQANSIDAVAAIGTPNACQTFDFAGGATQGFTTEPVFGTPLVLWHVTNNLCRAQLLGHSTPYTFYYGQDISCNYDTGARNAANLISPLISLTGIFPPYSIGFNYLLFVEGGGFDTTFVDISTNNGATWTQILSKANLINDNQWHNRSLDVTALVGAATSVRLRFRFDTIDNIANATTGWHVDDIQVCGQPFNFCLQDDSNGNILQFNSLTGAYQFTQCSTGLILTGTGTVTVNGCNLQLNQNTTNRKVSATVDTCTNSGSAVITVRTPLRATFYSINDSNTTNNTCTCP
jgi:hypothetical protein